MPDRPTVVVTGASSGIGHATALAFARRGARLMLAARRADVLHRLAAECRDAGAADAAVAAVDITEHGAAARLGESVVAHWGRLDVWVNCAAVALFASFGEEPEQELRRVIEVNAIGTALASRTAVLWFREQGEGVLINVGSALSSLPSPRQVGYVMSKHAIRGLSASLRTELTDCPDIHVCLVLPGAVDTPLFDHAANHTGRALRAMAPVLSPERVAAAIVSCAERPRREVKVGWMSRLGIAAFAVAPAVTERIVSRSVERGHFTDQPAAPTSGNLFQPLPGGTTASGGWKHADSLLVRRIASGAALLALLTAVLRRRR